MAEIPLKWYAYGAAVGGIFALLISVTNTGAAAVILAPFAALMLMLSWAIYKYGYLLIPLLTRGARIVEVMEGGYEIPPGQQAVLKKVGDIYYATMFLGVRLFESVTEKGEEERQSYAEFFERAISSVKHVTKFSIMVHVKDTSKYRESLETKRMEAQLRLAREREKPEPDVLKLDRYEREVAMWDGQLAGLVAGKKPMGVLMYAMTTATGVTKDSAIAAARAQANELRATISNALNCEVVLLEGEEMKKCFEWEHFLPPEAKAFEEAAST